MKIGIAFLMSRGASKNRISDEPNGCNFCDCNPHFSDATLFSDCGPVDTSKFSPKYDYDNAGSKSTTRSFRLLLRISSRMGNFESQTVFD
jgi:hypothetical protein